MRWDCSGSLLQTRLSLLGVGRGGGGGFPALLRAEMILYLDVAPSIQLFTLKDLPT